ncbi:MAG: cysteine desulfurase [Oscillospiraceae bacterium]|nr:cysteine desulfurase [Oscillospiraceae bacterium]
MIYLDHAASAPPLSQALETQLRVSREAFGNPSGIHATSALSRRHLRLARKTISEVANMPASSIIFTSGGTESNNWAIRMAALSRKKKGRHIILSQIEHASVLRSGAALEALGFTVTRLAPGPDGRIAPRALEAAVRPDTVLISLQSANNETGILQDVKSFTDIARAHGILYHCDAVQSFGHVSQPFEGADLVTFSSHKLGGPAGVGVLALPRGFFPPPLLEGGGQEFGLRSGTENVPAIAGFAAACEIVFSHLEQESARQAALRDGLLAQLRARIPHLEVNGSGPCLPHILNLRLPGLSGELLAARLDLRGICISTGAACAARDPRPSHVLLAMGRTEREARESVRISLGPSSSWEHIEQTAQSIIDIYQAYAK